MCVKRNYSKATKAETKRTFRIIKKAKLVLEMTHIPTQQSQKGTRATSPEDVKAGVVPKGICAASVFISIVFTYLQNTTG